jgi:hypothetical protein
MFLHFQEVLAQLHQEVVEEEDKPMLLILELITEVLQEQEDLQLLFVE